MVSSGEARKSGSSPVPAQGLLFDDDLPELDEDIGYRGPTACKAAGITYRQLDYWARTGLVEPSVRRPTGSGTQRLYGFRDILVLKVVKRLLDTGVSLQQIRDRDRAPARPRRRRPRPDHPDERRRLASTSAPRPTRSSTSLQGGQGVFGIAVGQVWREVEGELAVPAERARRGRGDGVRRAAARRRARRPPRRPPRLTRTPAPAPRPGVAHGRPGRPVVDFLLPLTPCGRVPVAPRRGAEGATSPEPLRRKDHAGQATLEHRRPRRR